MTPFLRLTNYVKKLRFFYVPNWIKLRRKNIKIKKPIHFNQKTIITGHGGVEINSGCTFGFKLGGFHEKGNIEIQPRYKNSVIVIGKNVSTNNNLFFCAANCIKIGDETLIGQNVTIMDHEAHGIHPEKRRQIGEIGQVQIGKNVWIGNDVTILKNTIIGNNSVVAAGAIVSGDFPPDVILGGIPSKVIKKLEY